ncbi:MAG TPA: cell division protein FtsQ/DivIB [Sphingobium sp.]|nr:cell division protein FtsQ/DivIB [Sphingobium sp.]
MDVGGARRRKARRRGLLDRLLDHVPLSPAQISALLTWIIAFIVIALVWLAARFFGLPAMVGAEVSQLAGRAGFQVARIEVLGLERMDEMPVSSIAVRYVDRSMLSVDLARLRADVMTLGWVKEARVSRRLPDTLVVDVVERQPAAVWQHDGMLSLVDAGGVELGPIAADNLPDLPLVVGPDANRQTHALSRLMDAAPALKPMLAGATWVGSRRWDLRFQSGEQLLLPEGEAEAAAALVNFARMDGVDRLLGRGVLRFDMRDPSRFVLRLPPGQGQGNAPTVSAATVQTVVTTDAPKPAASPATEG